MPTLNEFADKKYYDDLWDVEAEIQKELDILDGSENNSVLGDAEIVEEEEKMNLDYQDSQALESLMERLSVQNKKLLDFECSLCPSEKHYDKYGIPGSVPEACVIVEAAQERDTTNVDRVPATGSINGIHCPCITNDAEDESQKLHGKCAISTMSMEAGTLVPKSSDLEKDKFTDLSCHEGLCVAKMKHTHRKENSKMERMEKFGNLEEKMHMKLMLFEEERNQDAYMLSLQDKQMRKRLDNLQICIEKTMELEKAWEKQRLDHRTQQRWHLAQKLLHAQLAQQVKRRNAAKRIFSAMRKQKLLLQKCTETNVLLLHKKSEKLRQKMKVLDLSFNKISQVVQLQQLGCFSKLRSLQLNDNPVSELPTYVEKVLEAIPWLVELDNEALSEYSRHQAVRNIFLEVMKVAGLQYVESNILKGKVPLLGLVDIFKQQEIMGKHNGSGMIKESFPNQHGHGSVAHGMTITKNSIPINKIMAGDADVTVLWTILLEVSQMYIVSCHRKDFVEKLYLPSQIEAQWRLQSLHVMCVNQKQQLLTGAREYTSLQENVKDECLQNVLNASHLQPEEESKHLPQVYGRPEYIKLIKSRETKDLEICLWEHIQFKESHYSEIFKENKEYQTELSIHCKRIVRMQAVSRGFLARRKYRNLQASLHCETSIKIAKLKELKDAETTLCNSITKVQAYWRGWTLRKSGLLHSLYSERHIREQALMKVQALWRGFRTRKRFLLAKKNAKYEDSDEFEYIEIEQNEFLPVNLNFEKFNTSNEVWQSEKFFHSDQKSQIPLTMREELEGASPPLVLSGQHEAIGKQDGEDSSYTSPQGDMPDRGCLRDCLYTSFKEDNVQEDRIPVSPKMSHCKNNAIETGKHLQTLDERKAEMAEIAKDWGFKQEKTALQFIRALENTRRRAQAPKPPIPDSQTRFKAFVARTGKHSGITATITLPENQGNSNLSCSVRDEVRVKNVSVTRAKNTATRYKEKLYTSASVKTLNLEQTNQQETFQKSAELPRAPLKNSFTRSLYTFKCQFSTMDKGSQVVVSKEYQNF